MVGLSPLRYPVRLFQRFAWPPTQPSFESPADFGLSPEPFTVVTADGLRIRGWTFVPADAWGVVILCHARSANKSRTLGHVRLLWEQRLGVVTFDFRGCGDSDAPRRQASASMRDPLRDLEAVASHAESKVADTPSLRGRVALLGCSFGGNMAIAHAGTTGRRYPAVILDSTPLVRWVEMLDDLLRKERRDADFPRLRALADLVVARSVATWTRAGPLYRHAKRSVRGLAGTRVLHIVGDRENLFDVEESCRFLYNYCAGPVEIFRPRRGRHLTNHLVDPDGYAERVTTCLAAAFGARRAEGAEWPPPRRLNMSTD